MQTDNFYEFYFKNSSAICQLSSHSQAHILRSSFIYPISNTLFKATIFWQSRRNPSLICLPTPICILYS